jgi:hypothetical protein
MRMGEREKRKAFTQVENYEKYRKAFNITLGCFKMEI